MNTTKQKAEAWLVKTIDVTDLSDEISRELTDAQEIITAMLAEHEALLGVVKYFNEHGDCLGSAMKIKQALTLCEKEHE